MLAQVVSPLFINNAGPWGLLLLAVVVLVLFGRGKVAGLMGEVGKGITAFKRGVKEGSEETEVETPTVQAPRELPAAPRDVTPERERNGL